jgi:hypothetical protein
MEFQYDAFICHASEDKDSLVRPLAKALVANGCRIWFDEMTLRIGDSLRRKIEEGLSSSRYGIVVLSPDFLHKEWPQFELDGLLAREMADSVKVILPIWHKVDAASIRRYSLPLSMRLGGSTASGLDKLALELVDIMQLGSQIRLPEIDDELSRAKNTILRMALENDNRITIYSGSLNSRSCVMVADKSFDETEEQRKLFQFALEELTNAGLVENISASFAELTYVGLQAAQRLPAVIDG